MLSRFRWPPDVTRRQTWRDIRLVLDAAEAGLFQPRGGDEVP